MVGSPMHPQSYPSPDKLQFSDRNWFALGELTFLNAKDRTCAVLENEVPFALQFRDLFRGMGLCEKRARFYCARRGARMVSETVVCFHGSRVEVKYV